MGFRLVHQIHSECDIFVARDGKNSNNVRVRITETDPDTLNPSDIEIEGNRDHIMEALSTCVDILTNIELLSKEPS